MFSNRIVRTLLVFMLVSVNNLASARYLQADKLDLLGRPHDPELQAVVKRQPVQSVRPDSLNHPYIYAAANPVMHTDRTGLCLEDACVMETMVAVAIATAMYPAISNMTHQIQNAMNNASSGSSSNSSSAGDDTDTGKQCPPEDKCKKARTDCAAKCSSMLPDSDLQSMNFQKCYSDCLADAGCLGVK